VQTGAALRARSGLAVRAAGRAGAPRQLTPHRRRREAPTTRARPPAPRHSRPLGHLLADFAGSTTFWKAVTPLL